MASDLSELSKELTALIERFKVDGAAESSQKSTSNPVENRHAG